MVLGPELVTVTASVVCVFTCPYSGLFSKLGGLFLPLVLLNETFYFELIVDSLAGVKIIQVYTPHPVSPNGDMCTVEI